MACILLGAAMIGLIIAVSLFAIDQLRYDGYVELEEDPGGIIRANLIMEGDPETLLQTKSSIRFKIKRDEVSHE